jgi:hypothetical protein
MHLTELRTKESGAIFQDMALMTATFGAKTLSK